MFWIILCVCSVIIGGAIQVFVQPDGFAGILGLLISLTIFCIGVAVSNLCYSGELQIDDPVKMEPFIVNENSTFIDFNEEQLTIRTDGKFETYNLGHVKILPLDEEDEPYIVKSRHYYKTYDSFWVIPCNDIVENNKTEIHININ